MVELIKLAAVAVGINAVITNSDERIETQLNSLTKVDDKPLFLISWDIDTVLSFNSNGVLDKPKSKITALLATKAYDMTKTAVESTLSAILGRMAIDAKREVTWDEMMRSA